jgi:hypothetical protein
LGDVRDTVTKQVSEIDASDADFAVIVTGVSVNATPVISPVLSTLTFAGSLDSHVISPAASVGSFAAVSVNVSPTTIVFSAGVTVIPVMERGD